MGICGKNFLYMPNREKEERVTKNVVKSDEFKKEKGVPYGSFVIK